MQVDDTGGPSAPAVSPPMSLPPSSAPSAGAIPISHFPVSLFSQFASVPPSIAGSDSSCHDLAKRLSHYLIFLFFSFLLVLNIVFLFFSFKL